MEDGRPIVGDVKASDRASDAEKLVIEARNMGHFFVGTEHLLLAAMRDESGATFRCLSRRDVSMVRLLNRSRY